MGGPVLSRLTPTRTLDATARSKRTKMIDIHDSIIYESTYVKSNECNVNVANLIDGAARLLQAYLDTSI